MKIALAFFASACLFAIAAVHFYWASGGKKGLSAALPELPNSDQKAFRPSPFLTFLVACVFAGMAFLVGTKGGLFFAQLVDNQWISGAARAVGVLFLARAVGDFRFVGVFKKVKKTRFAELDSKFYAPLSAAIGAAILAAELF